jgi:[acyl-carrier-protein] S-malonyltransferase
LSKKIAFVFPGQGSQAVGMLNDFAQDAALAAVISSADLALNESLSTLIAQGPAEQLNLTVNTQPAMLLAAVVAWQAWQNAGGPKASVMAGHSLGEYSALTAAGVFSLPDALRLVRVRAQAMQSAVPIGTGAMAAILGLSDEQVLQACQEAATQTSEVVEAVNFNAPAQVVIAGTTKAVAAACEAAKALGAKRALPLPVSAPFHSSLLKPAGLVLGDALAKLTLAAPQIPVVNNVDVLAVNQPADIADALVRQAFHPVRWVETVQHFSSLGIDTVIELGPGKVLSGLIKRIAPEITAHAVFDRASLQLALTAIQ